MLHALQSRHGRSRTRQRTLALLMALTALCATAATTLTAPPAAAAAPTTAPELLAPAADAEVEGNPVLRWTAVDGAVKYRVQISTNDAFTSLKYSQDSYGLSATPPADLPLGLLHWRVSGVDAGGAAGPANTSSFTKGFATRPLLLEPVDDPTGDRPLEFPHDPALLTWSPLAGAKTYELEIDDDQDFIGATLQKTENTSFTLLEPQTAGRYFWRVRGKSGLINSAWSETRSYVVRWPEVPTLLSPQNTTATTVEDVVLRWTPVVGAATYQLQVSSNGDWDNNLQIDTVIKGTQYSPINKTTANSINNGSYFWRVRARDARATPSTGPWSEPWQFQRAWTDRPTLIAPADDDVAVEVPTFRWTGVDHASHYDLQIGTDVNFSPNTFVRCLVSQTSYTPYGLRLDQGGTSPVVPTAPSGASCGFPLAIGTTYYWRVRGVDDPAQPTVVGLVSAVSRFVLRPPIPQIVSPGPSATPAVMTAPVLSWEPVLGASDYLVTVKKANGATVVGAVATESTSYTPTTKLLPADGPFSWYVQTRGGLIPASDTWGSFQVADPTETTLTPELLTGADGASDVRMPSMTWTPVTGAAKYSVRYGVLGSGVVDATPLASNLPFGGFTAQTALLQGSYFWYVEAYAANGSKISESTSTGTFTVAGLELTELVAPAKCTPEAACATLLETPSLEWNHVPAAGSYLVYLAKDPNFTSLLRVYQTSHPTLTPRESLLDSQAGEAYYWFVRPCRTAAGGRCGPFETAVDTAFAFRKASSPVRLVSPADGAVVTDGLPRFEWEDYFVTSRGLTPPVNQGAKLYRLQLSTVADFSTVLDTQLVDQTSFAPTLETYPEGPLFWRVQAVDASNNSLTFSEVRRLTKQSGSPATTSPAAAGRVEGVPFFRWQPQPYAARYEVEVAANADTTFSAANRVVTISSVKQTAWSPTDSMKGQGTYAWRMRAIDVDGRAGAWTPGATFMLAADEPTLRAPVLAAVARTDSIVFDWDPVPAAAQYRLQTSTLASFSTTVESQLTVMDIWSPTRLYSEGTYFWRVQVLDADGNILSTSPSNSVDQAKRTITVCGSGPADHDGDGFKDGCDDVDDVDNRQPIYDSVKALLNIGVTRGCSSTGDILRYCPHDRVIRGEMALFLSRFKLGVDGAESLPPYQDGTFTDVAPGDFFANAARYLKENQITVGCNADGTAFCPYDPVLRAQMALFIARTKLGAAQAGALPAYEPGTFTDVVAEDSYANAVRYLKDTRITVGCAPGRFCPQDHVTRLEMALFLVRALRL